MHRVLGALLVVALASACDRPVAPKTINANTPEGRLEQLVAANATIVGYLYTAEKPFVIASFRDGALQWRHDPDSKAMIQGPAELFSEPDRACVGFAAKTPSMPAQGPQRFLVCEALRPIEHSNSLPRSQDFRLAPGTLFLEYQPPSGTGYPQFFYASRAK